MPADDKPPVTVDITPLAPLALPTWQLWRLYLLCALTFGIYSFVWAYRVAKPLWDTNRTRIHPLLWAASMIGNAPSILGYYGLARQAEQEAARSGRTLRRVAPGVVVIQFLFTFSARNSEVLLPWLILAPIPLLLVQRAINRLASPKVPAASFSRAQQAALLAGAAATVALVWMLDLPVYRRAQQFSAADRPTADAPLYGRSRTYALHPTSSRWIYSNPAKFGESADLALEQWDQETWLVVYVARSPDLSVQDAVLARRQALETAGFHLENESSRAATRTDPERMIATYRPDDTSATQSVITTVMRGRDVIVEVIGFASAGDLDEVRDLVQGVTLTPDEQPS